MSDGAIFLSLLTKLGAWRDQALCAITPGDWITLGTNILHRPQYRTTKAAEIAVCGRCPVSAPCLEWALANREEFGIWGGYTPAERQAMLRERRDLETRTAVR